MIIVGIDPALNRTGWGVIELRQGNVISFVGSGIIDVSSFNVMTDKLEKISNSVNEMISIYSPDEISIEEVFVSSNPATSLKLGHARGAIIVSCLRHNKKIYEYGANYIKKSICGAGKAQKDQVARMVKILLPKAEFKYSDESDALAAAITHAHSRQMNSFKVSY